MDEGILVEFNKPPSQPHELKWILDHHELRTCHHIHSQLLVKQKDRLDKGSTWENISTLCKKLPTFVFEGKNSSSRGD